MCVHMWYISQCVPRRHRTAYQRLLEYCVVFMLSAVAQVSFRRLGIFILSTMPQFTQLHK